MAPSRIEVDFTNLQKEVSNCEQALDKLIKVKKMMSANATEINKINKKLHQNPVALGVHVGFENL